MLSRWGWAGWDWLERCGGGLSETSGVGSAEAKAGWELMIVQVPIHKLEDGGLGLGLGLGLGPHS